MWTNRELTILNLIRVLNEHGRVHSSNNDTSEEWRNNTNTGGLETARRLETACKRTTIGF